MSNDKGKKGKKGGFGKALVVMVLLVAGGGAAVWFLAPDVWREHIAPLTALLGN